MLPEDATVPVQPNAGDDPVIGAPPSRGAEPSRKVPAALGAETIPTRKQSELRKLHLENERLELENEKLRFENQRIRNDVWRGRIDLGLRATMAVGLFTFVCWYLTAVVGLAGRPTGETRLTDAALVALFGSTTVNVIGLLLTVARYLFPASSLAPKLDA